GARRLWRPPADLPPEPTRPLPGGRNTSFGRGDRLWLSLRPNGLPLQQPRLSVLAPAVPSARSVASDDAVAGDDQRGGVRGAGGSYRPGGSGISDRCGDLSVGAGFTAGDLSQLAPDAEGEGAGPQGDEVERQVGQIGACSF